MELPQSGGTWNKPLTDSNDESNAYKVDDDREDDGKEAESNKRP